MSLSLIDFFSQNFTILPTMWCEDLNGSPFLDKYSAKSVAVENDEEATSIAFCLFNFSVDINFVIMWRQLRVVSIDSRISVLSS